tara:strand:- start:463 stop:1464 length:1002 start_codon:yes stop_codon:yes gene_type:complete
MVKVQPSQKLRDAIMKDRKDLKEISLNSYITSLRSLYKTLNPDTFMDTQLSTDFLKDDKVEIMKHLKTRKITSSKNVLTAIIVGLSSDTKKDDKLLEYYQEQLKKLSGTYNKFLETQSRTPTQTKNWISFDEFIEVINKLLAEVKEEGINKKEKLTRSEFNVLQRYTILSFYQVFPMRNDVANMRVISKTDYDKLEEKERLDNNYFVKDNKKYIIKLNQFKNVKRIGPKSFDVPEKLGKIVKLWLKHNTSGFLFTMNNMRDPLSPNGITKLLNSIFKKYADGKSIGSSMLRHISISEKMKNEPSIAEKKEESKEIEDKFMHSSSMHERYRKVD